MELTQEAQRKEMQGWMEQLQELKHQNEESKEIHRHETQTLKQRAKHSEDSARELSTQLLEKVRYSQALWQTISNTTGMYATCTG